MQGELYPPQGAVTLEQALESESEERKRRKKKPKGNDEDDGKVGKNETEGGEVSKDSALDGEDEEKKKKSDGDGSSGKKKKKKKSGGGSSLANSRKKTKKGSKKVKEDEDGESGDGESGSSKKKKKKKESKEEKKKTRKNLKALAATLPNPRIASSSSASSTSPSPSPSPSSTTSPSSNGYAASNAQFSASSGKISLAAKSKSSDSASRLAGALTWNDLPDTPIKKKKTKSSSSSINKKKRQDAGGGGSDSDALMAAEDDVEEWERSGSADVVLCTIGHFKQLSLSDEGRRFDPKAGPVDDDGGDNHDEVADAVDGNDDGDDSDVDDERLKLPLPKENDESGCSKDETLRLSPRGWADLSIAGSGGGGGSAPTTSRTASPDAKCAQLHKLRSMEPTVVWRSLQKADLLGLVASPGAPPADDGGRSERKKRTDMLWQELIDTEINYVKNLNTIIQEFVVPLTTLANEGKGALSPGQVDLIFSRVTPLHAIHEALLAEFRRAEAGGCTFSDAFLTFMPFLKVYSTYVNKHPSAIELLIKLQRSSSRFRKFLDECMNKTGMDVESFLILPIQRLPRYELILNDLVRQTMMCSAPGEHAKLKKLLASIKEINTAVVESRKREESAERMYQIYASLAFPSKQKELDVFDETIRVFVREGMLDVCLPPDSNFVPRCFILFTDILICTVKKGSTMKFEYFFKLANITTQSTGKDLTLLFGDDNVFALADRKKSGGGSRGSRGSRGAKVNGAAESGNDNVLYLRASSAEEKEAWVNELDQLCARAQVAETKKARRSITMPNLKDMLEAEMEKERKEEEEAATKQSATERRKSRRLSLRFNSSLLQSRSKSSTGS